MRPVVFSASSMNLYHECHLAWWFTHVAAIPAEQTEPQAVGITVHEAAEHLLRGTLPLDAFDDFPPHVVSLIHLFDREVLPTYRNPVLIEASFEIAINGIPYSGIIDSVDEHHIEVEPPELDEDFQDGQPAPMPRGVYEWDARILRDLKTTGSRPAAGRYRLNVTGYWLGAESLGVIPHAAQLDWIVRTKTPYYWPEVMDPIDDDDVNLLAATLERAAEGVARGDYQPTGLGTRACVSCGYKAVCGPYQRLQEVNP